MAILDYYWLPLATIYSVDKIGKIWSLGYSFRFYTFFETEDRTSSSLVAFDYQWLPLAIPWYIIIGNLKFEAYLKVFYSSLGVLGFLIMDGG